MLAHLERHYHFSRKLLLLRLGRHLGGPRLALLLGRLLYHLRVEGWDNLPRQGGCLVAFNHASMIADALLFLSVDQRRPDACLLAHSLTGELFVKALGALGLPRAGERVLAASNRRQFAAAELLNAREKLLRGGCLVMAPEGELTWDGQLQHPLAPGAAWLALRSSVPILPMVSRGGYDVQPLWQMDRTYLTGRISLRIGQPLVLCEGPRARLTEAELEEASQRLWQALAELLKP